jgi:hypothetical protein
MAITASALPFLLTRATTAWPGSMLEQDFVPQIETLNVIAAQQTARIDPNLPLEAKSYITWMNNCDIAEGDCTDSCTISGPTADSTRQEIEMVRCKEIAYVEPLDPWIMGGRVNEFALADALAVNLNKAMKVAAEGAAQYAVTKINTFLGVNLQTLIPNWTVTSTDTDVPFSEFDTTRVFGRFARTAQRNKFNSPYLLSGGTLNDLVYMSRTGSMNADGKGDANRILTQPIYEDVFNLPVVNGSAEIIYMINRGSLAFASRGWYGTTPTTLGGNTTRFSIPNRFFPQLIHDVEVQETCTGGAWSVSTKVKHRYDLFLNPVGCTATQTGVLKFTVNNTL